MLFMWVMQKSAPNSSWKKYKHILLDAAFETQPGQLPLNEQPMVLLNGPRCTRGRLQYPKPAGRLICTDGLDGQLCDVKTMVHNILSLSSQLQPLIF